MREVCFCVGDDLGEFRGEYRLYRLIYVWWVCVEGGCVWFEGGDMIWY